MSAQDPSPRTQARNTAAAITASPDWTRLHEDETASVFVVNR